MSLRVGEATTRRELTKVRRLGEPNYPTPYSLAAVHAGLGNNAESIPWLELAYEQRSDWMPYLRADSMFHRLRADRKFTELLSLIDRAGT